MKRIKDNIEKKDFRFLINFLEADENIRASRKNRLQKIFTLLYTTGIRLNEVQELTEDKLIELIETGKTKIIASKQKKEKFIYLSVPDRKLVQKHFNEERGFSLLSERKNKFHSIALINDVNSYLKKVFPNKNITSHSFRQTLITELAHKSINPSTIQHLVGHKDVKTTLGYIKVSEENIFNALETR